MRIKKLEIYNIASIEEAVIEFDRQPLSDAELFLITGTTGAGKTTLLDAICLALYNTTPRIVKGKRQDFQINNDGLTECDPRNIMRQNTGYAYSRVCFEGNDGKEYCAEWSVERGTKRKPTSNLSNAVWQITENGTGKTVTGNKNSSYKEVEEIITGAVGLDYNQFCRTTMLAQGEFTEFLKSDEDAKAEILEKISGSDIYRKIGAEIFNQCSISKKKMEEEEEKFASIVVMSEEERLAKESELENIEKELGRLSVTSGMLQTQIAWLGDETSLSAKVAETRTALESAEEAVGSEEYKLRLLDVRQWNETIDVREALRSAVVQKRNAEHAAGELEKLKEDYIEAISGEAYLIGHYNARLNELEAISSQLLSQEKNVTAYNGRQAVIADIRNFKVSVQDLEGKQETLRIAVEEQFPEAQVALAESAGKLEKAAEVLEACRAEYAGITAELERSDLPGLRKEKEFLRDISAIRKGIEEYDSAIEELRKSMADDRTQLEVILEKERKEKEELERLTLEHERRKQTIDRFAKQMRSVLHEGLGKADNMCPVCGQQVNFLKSDALLDEEYMNIQNEFNEQKKKADTVSAEVIRLKNLLSLSEGRLADMLKRKADGSDKLNVMASERNDADILKKSSSDELYAMMESLTKRIMEGEAIEIQQKSISNKLTTLVSEKGKAETRHINDKALIESIDSDIKRLSSEIEAIKARITRLEADIDLALKDSLPWENEWKVNADGFIVEIADKGASYDNIRARQIRVNEIINASRPVIENISDLKERLRGLMPGWSEDGVVPKKVEGLQNCWNILVSNVSSAIQSLTNAKAQYEDYLKDVKAFLTSNPDYTLEKLEELMCISTERHNSEAAYISEIQAVVATASSRYESAEKEYSEHLQNRPDGLAEEDTLDGLTEARNECDRLRDENNIRKGVIVKELEDDDKAIKLKGDTTRLDQLKVEYEKWRRFNAIFGDKEGRTLSKIAQSYVLGTLLDAANHHLRKMAPRYRLLVNPGSLNLKLEDKYNGYSTRSTNSISGGESFLVSLALALALADFGQHLGVSMLFIDEGFGTLSGEALQNAINTLKTLHSDYGRQVGIISHREEIRESIPTQIKVNLTSGTSASKVEVTDRRLD